MINRKKLIKKGAIPFFSAAIFGLTIFYWNSQNYGLALEYNGEEIATISNADVYEQANKLIVNQTYQAEKEEIKKAPTQIKLTAVNASKCCKTATEIKNKIIENPSTSLSQGFGIYVNGKLVAVGKNENSIKTMLMDILSSKKVQNSDWKVSFLEEISVTPILFKSEEIKSDEDIKEILNSSVENTEKYTVTDDDSIESICNKFNLSESEINEPIYPGDILKIRGTKKLINVKVYKSETEEHIIPFATEKTEDDNKDEGWQEKITDGKPGREIVTYELVLSENGEVSKTQIQSVLLESSVTEKIKVGTRKHEPEYTNLLWPVPFTKNITSPFGKRGSEMHKGIDIAASGIAGKDIVAANSGTVVFAGYSTNGYGNHVIIKHKDGKETLYGHCKNVFVTKGQTVSRGDVIAAVGTTGRSTGNHLHFEVRVGGEAQDPKKYV